MSTSASIQAPSIQDQTLLEQVLNPKQYQALKEAQDSGTYSVHILEKTINGHRRYCAVVGETHIKLTAKSDAVSRSLANAFRRFGVEGADPYLNWSGTAMVASLIPSHLLSLLSQGDSSIGEIKRQHGTTVFGYPDALQALADHYDLESKSPEEQKRIRIRVWIDRKGRLQIPESDNLFGNWPIVKTSSIFKSENRAPQEVTGKQIMDALAPTANRDQIFLLEYQHHPGLYENVAITLYSLLVFSSLVGILSRILTVRFYALQLFSCRAFIGVTSMMLLGFAFDCFVLPNGHRKISKVINPLFGGLTYPRNDTMAYNLNRIMAQDDDRVMLNIMGAFHVNDFCQLMKSHYHFHEIPFQPLR